MRLLKIWIPVSILLLAVFAKAQQQDGSVFERRISIDAEKQSLGIILDQLSWQARVFFSYDSSIIDADKIYSVRAIDKSLFSVLNQLFPSKKYSFTELENQIVITQKNKENTVLNAARDSIPVKYFFLTGKIIDRKKDEPISYASVSVFNKPIGTITNTDGDFLLKLHPENIRDTIVISCMGFAQIFMPAYQLLDEDIIPMDPISIRIREVKVTSTSPEKLLENIRANIAANYRETTELMTAFYRETLKQDNKYINVSEAVMEILKSSYTNKYRSDVVRLIKGRRSPDVQPFAWINFKLQGGPFTVTQLDVVKTMESFLDEEYQNWYKYNIRDVIRYNEYPVYVLEFQPVASTTIPTYVGEIYVHRETFAIVHANFRLNKNGLKQAESILVKRKPPGVKARPSFVEYDIDYQQYQDKWHLKTARASVKFKIRSRKDRINSEFHSVSELLVTDIESTELKKFTRQESFTQRDVFVEMIDNYDPQFWENYNIIKPDEDLRNAFKNFSQKY